MSAIKPALGILSELDDKNFLDKLAVAIHDATAAVTVLGKGAKIQITIDVDMLSKKGMTEPVITMEAEINTKLPKPDANRALFFVDEDGNPTPNQQRQRGLDLSIAPTDVAQQEQSKHG